MRVHRDWLLTTGRVAIHEPTATAVVADLHLGYNEARRRGGEAVPLFDIEHHLLPLSKTMQSHNVRRLVIAGDMVEDVFDDSLMADFAGWLGRTGVELAGIVPGNHDRGVERYAERFPVFPTGIHLGGWQVVHGDGTLVDEPIVQGHLHPSITWRGRCCPCYLVGGGRLILPAYSRDARGVNIRTDPTLRDHRCIAILGDRLVSLKGETRRARRS